MKEMLYSNGDTRSKNFTLSMNTACNENGEDPLRVGAIVLIVVAGILLVLVFFVGTHRYCRDCKKKRDAKRAAQEPCDFDSIVYDLGLDERDRFSEGSDSSVFARPEPVIRELHFPVTRANEVHMADSLQVGNLSAFTNVGQFNDNKGWGSPSHQALYRGDDKVVETNFSRFYDNPSWHTTGNTNNTAVINDSSSRDFMYATPRDINQARLSPAQREVNNFVALQIASNIPRVNSSPLDARRKLKGSQITVPGVHSTTNLAAVQMTSHNFQNSPITERKPHETAANHGKSPHANAYYIGDKSRTVYGEYHEVKAHKPHEFSRYPGKAQNARIVAKNDDVREPSRVPVLGKDAEYWNYYSKVHPPTPDITTGKYSEPKKAGKSNKGHKAGKRDKPKQTEVKYENVRERAKPQNTTYEDSEELEFERPKTRTERSMSTKKKEDMLVNELKARLGQRQGSPGAGEEHFF